MRLFIAIEIPDELKSALGKLHSGIAGARWVPEEQLHLTLAFVGEVDAAASDLLSERLAGISSEGFILHFSRLGCFPNNRKPRVIWAGLEPEPLLGRLVSLVRQAALDTGILLEERPFAPHITLARFRQPPGREIGPLVSQLQLPKLQPVIVEDFILYCSSLTASGAIHTPLRHFPLLPANR